MVCLQVRVMEQQYKITRNILINSGEPSITGIPIRSIVDRFRAGDSVADLAADFGREPAVIEAAIRWRLRGGRYFRMG